MISTKNEGWKSLRLFLLIDFGSTYTKIIAADLDSETVLGCAQSRTTIDSDVAIGMKSALSELRRICGVDADSAEGIYACSSAAGGLKMAAIGLTPSLTLEAASRAALGAGAKVVFTSGFELDNNSVTEIENKKCDIVLLCGGTDGGNKDVILHNSEMLARSAIECPVLVAGNRIVSERVCGILESAGKSFYLTNNVLPDVNVLDIEPAKALIRDIFIGHIIKAKGLHNVRSFISGEIIPTPKASLLAASLLADGTTLEPGIGSLMVVEIGGATINVHSVADAEPVTAQTIVRGLPEERVKRTVEGDLGIRWNARTIYEMSGQQKLTEALLTCGCELDAGNVDFKVFTDMLSENVGHVPLCELESNMDIALGKCAAEIAVERHAGILSKEMTVNGEVYIQRGKNLLSVQNVIGTGGIFKYGLKPRRILDAAFTGGNPWSLQPKSPRFFLDDGYILYGVGLLSEQYPDEALRLAKKYILPAQS